MGATPLAKDPCLHVDRASIVSTFDQNFAGLVVSCLGLDGGVKIPCADFPGIHPLFTILVATLYLALRMRIP